MMTLRARGRRALLVNWRRASSWFGLAPIVALAVAAALPQPASAQNISVETENVLNLLQPFLTLNSSPIGQQTLTASGQQAVLINQNSANTTAFLISPSQINPNAPSAFFLNGSQPIATVAALAINDENSLGGASTQLFGTTINVGPAANLAGALPTQNLTTGYTFSNGIHVLFNGAQSYGAFGSVLGQAYFNGVNPASPSPLLASTITLLSDAFCLTGNLKTSCSANGLGDVGIAKSYFSNGTLDNTTTAVAPAGSTLPTANGLPNKTSSVYDIAFGVTNGANVNNFITSEYGTYPQNTFGNSHPYQTFQAVSSSYSLYDPSLAYTPTGTNVNTPSANGAFPSAHMTYSTTHALLLGQLVPQFYQPLLLRASEIGESRIVTGNHYPTDIIGSRSFVSYDMAQFLSNPAYATAAVTGSSANGNLSANIPSLLTAAQPGLLQYLNNNTAGCGGSIAACAANTVSSPNPYAPSATNAQIYEGRLTYGLPTMTFAQWPREQAPAGGPDASILLAGVYGGSTSAAKTIAPNGGLNGNLSSNTINQIVVNTETDAIAAYTNTNLSYWSRINLYNAAGYFGGVAGTLTFATGDQVNENVTIAGATTNIIGDAVPAGVLGGPGAITGNVLVQAGGTFAPGTTGAPGNSTSVTGTLAFQPGAFYSVGVNSTTSNFASVSGTAALGGNVAVTVAPGTSPLHNYTILQTGGLNGTTFAGATVGPTSPPNYLAGLSYSANNVFLNVTVLAATHDFNGDNKSDVLFRDTAGDVGLWLMNGASVLQAKTVGNVPNNWSIVGQRDFNDDGNSDVLWRDTAGDVGIWLMNGATVLQSATFAGVPTSWSIVGTGDFNGDGNADILWRDTSGNVGIWLMKGTTILQSAVVGNLSTSWVVAGADMKGDIFWRNTSTGEVGMWVMNGTTVAKAVDFGVVSAAWTIAGIGDFDANGSTDILWRDSSGNVAIWLMNGTSILSTALVGNVSANWTIAETGDYNGDGKSDILWIDTSGNVGVWFMNGTTVSSSLIYGNVGTAWTVQALNAD